MIVIMLCILLRAIASDADETVLSKFSEINIPEDGRLNFIELARKYDLNAEEIEVETEDGYLITMFHIPGKKKPVLMVHGFADSSITWLLRGKASLAVALAKEGYDAWYGNVRGNKYARKHVSLNPDEDDQFWNFSFHEMGFYDWSAMIDRVLKETSETKLNTIGHSQGVTSLLALLSTRPEYNEKVNLNIGLAGLCYVDKVGPAVTLIIKAGPILEPFLEMLEFNELFSENSLEKDLVQLLCAAGFVTEVFCREGVLSLITGSDPDGIEAEFMAVIFGQFPAGASKKSLVHFYQMALSKKFVQYDYDFVKNMVLYGTSNPPDYNLTKVTANMGLMYGENDLASTPTSVKHIARALPNVVYLKAVEKKEWNHIDFTWSKEMEKYLFGDIIKLLEKYDW